MNILRSSDMLRCVICYVLTFRKNLLLTVLSVVTRGSMILRKSGSASVGINSNFNDKTKHVSCLLKPYVISAILVKYYSLVVPTIIRERLKYISLKVK
jgi:hypothetical protein